LELKVPTSNGKEERTKRKRTETGKNSRDKEDKRENRGEKRGEPFSQVDISGYATVKLPDFATRLHILGLKCTKFDFGWG